MTNGRRSSYAKRWCYTLNNFTSGELEKLRGLFESEDVVLYHVYGREVGDSGTPHIQGYVELSTRKRLNFLKEKISQRAHFEVSRGTAEENYVYCTKDGEFDEDGEISKTRTQPGRRTDLEAIKADLVAHKPMADIAVENFAVWCNNYRAFAKFADMHTVKRSWETEVKVFWGSTGTGKTRKVYELEENVFVCPDNKLKWFDGYEQEEAVLFDDFISIKNDKFDFLLRLLDRYPMKVPIKGGFVNWAPKRIYFTSNLHPNDWYIGVSPASMDALRRRITSITEIVMPSSGES